MKFLPSVLDSGNIVDILSDLKHRVYPRPFERLALAGKKDLTGVEIGVFEGKHSLSLLKFSDTKKLYLIDPYELYDDYAEGKKHYGVDQPTLSQAKATAHQNLKGFSDKVVWVEKYSVDAISAINERLDYVYIDGNHQANYVMADILSFVPLIKAGGVIGGHDFYNGFERGHDGVVKSVSQYAIENKLPLQVELPDWWIQL